jgi:hypothetical protein
MPADTLSISQETIQRWLNDHDYTSGLSPYEHVAEKHPFDVDPSVGSDGNIFGDFFQWLGNVPSVVWWILLALLLGLSAFFVLRQVDWHKNKKRKAADDDDADPLAEDIYAIDDYVGPIAQAEGNGEWAEAVRLVYLATLRHLDETGRIHWERHKTPMEYVDEADAEALMPLTLIYLSVRFGHYPADQALYQKTVALRTEIEKGGAHA